MNKKKKVVPYSHFKDNYKSDLNQLFTQLPRTTTEEKEKSQPEKYANVSSAGR